MLEVTGWAITAILVLFVGGTGVAGVAISYYEEFLARKERRERLRNQTQNQAD
jgi:hypothetical protein